MEKANQDIKRIAIIGAESTGKTTLARSLALRYQTIWVPEYAREYMTVVDYSDYTLDDIINIAKEQKQQEEQAIGNANKLLITDTEFITAKVWCEDVFGTCPKWIEEQVQTNRYDLYLLTANDLPWVPDPVRINSQRREYFFNWYKRELEQEQLPFEIVSGKYEARLFCAVQAIKKRFAI